MFVEGESDQTVIALEEYDLRRRQIVVVRAIERTITAV